MGHNSSDAIFCRSFVSVSFVGTVRRLQYIDLSLGCIVAKTAQDKGMV